jgi:hypothetical protein
LYCEPCGDSSRECLRCWHCAYDQNRSGNTEFPTDSVQVACKFTACAPIVVRKRCLPLDVAPLPGCRTGRRIEKSLLSAAYSRFACDRRDGPNELQRGWHERWRHRWHAQRSVERHRHLGRCWPHQDDDDLHQCKVIRQLGLGTPSASTSTSPRTVLGRLKPLQKLLLV